MIEVKSYEEIDRDRFAEFLQEELNSADPAVENMRDLPKLIEERFSKCFHVLLEDGQIVGCSGAYMSDFSPHVALLGCRSWLTKRVRAHSYIRDYLLPVQRTWAIQNNALVVAISFNHYNKGLRSLFTRKLMHRVERSSEMLFFKNMHGLEFPVLIKNTPQWVLYEKIHAWDFDWPSIAVLDSPEA